MGTFHFCIQQNTSPPNHLVPSYLDSITDQQKTSQEDVKNKTEKKVKLT